MGQDPTLIGPTAVGSKAILDPSWARPNLIYFLGRGYSARPNFNIFKKH